MRKGREAECEKAKLTQTLSITFHLTHADDNVDMRPSSVAPTWDWLLACALSTMRWEGRTSALGKTKDDELFV